DHEDYQSAHPKPLDFLLHVVADVNGWPLLSGRSIRPARCVVVPVPGHLFHVLAISPHREHLYATRTSRGERQVATVGRVRGTLIASFTERNLACRSRRQIEDLDVVARSSACGERDLVEWRWRPRRSIGIRLRGADSSQVQAIHADGVDLRLAWPV